MYGDAMADIVYFDPVVLDLQRELFNPAHAELVSRLERHPVDDIELKFAEIATYLDIILDGDYTNEDFMRLAKIFTAKLQTKRGAHAGFLIVNELPEMKQ